MLACLNNIIASFKVWKVMAISPLGQSECMVWATERYHASRKVDILWNNMGQLLTPSSQAKVWEVTAGSMG